MVSCFRKLDRRKRCSIITSALACYSYNTAQRTWAVNLDVESLALFIWRNQLGAPMSSRQTNLLIAKKRPSSLQPVTESDVCLQLAKSHKVSKWTCQVVHENIATTHTWASVAGSRGILALGVGKGLLVMLKA